MTTPTTIYVLSGNGQTANVSTQFPVDLVAVLLDEFNNPMPGQTVEFTPANGTSAPSGQFAGAFGPYFPDSVVTDVNGRANATHLVANTRVGTWNGTVASAAVPAVSTVFNMTNVAAGAPVATTLNVTANAIQKAARNTAYLAVTVRVLDQFSAGYPGATVTMSGIAGFGTFPGGFTSNSKVTDASGNATFAIVTASSTLGSFAPTINTPGVSTQFCSFKNINPFVVTSISVYSGQGQSAAPGAAFAQPLVGRAANELNNPVAGAVLTFDAPNSGASLVWTLPATDPVSVATNALGLATSPTMTANATAGSYNVVLTYPSITARRFGLTNGGSPPPEDSSLALCEV